MAVEGESLEDETRCERCLRCCRTGTTFLFSHIGLCALVVGYTLVGALMFENLESPHEEESREKIVKERKRVLNDIWTYTEESPFLMERNWSQQVHERLQEFEEKIVEAVRKDGWDGAEPGLPLQWSYTGSVFFSIIVITTIGYGNIAPKTSWGKILTIVYALVGIPLLLLCLSNIGDIMAHSFKFLYWRVCCYLCVQPRKRSRQQKTRHVSRHYFSTPYATPTPTTADNVPPFFPVNGRYVPTNGLPDGLSDGRVISNKYVLQSDKDVPSPPTLPSPTTAAEWTRRDLVEASDSEDESEGTEDVAVPIWLCIAVVVSYICGGAALFMYWEEWLFLDSAYFCFVTLTTIGFGDLVPGSAVLASEAKVALGLCSLYLLLGMALLAMSFNLVQEEVTQTVKAIGKRIGIIADEDNDDDY